MQVAITGASGFLGQAITQQLIAEGHEPRPVQRDGGSSDSGLQWTVTDGFTPKDALSGIDAVIHLAGENIGGGRWTEARKQAILDSRREGTARVVQALEHASPRPRVLISASAVGYYGSRGDEPLDEQSSHGQGFLAEVCEAWEAQARRAETLGVRVVIPRFGLVLGNGGALEKMLLPFRFGLGGRFGDGLQYMPWIHIHDLARAMVFLLEGEERRGVYNFTAPEPVTNQTFSATLGRVLSRPAFLPAPAFALKLALGDMAQALLLEGQRALPKRLLDEGFRFEYTDLDRALRQILEPSK